MKRGEKTQRCEERVAIVGKFGRKIGFPLRHLAALPVFLRTWLVLLEAAGSAGGGWVFIVTAMQVASFTFLCVLEN